MWLFLRTWPHTPQVFLETSRQAGHILLEREGQPQHQELHALFFYEPCVGSLITSHVEILNMEGIVRRGLRFIVLIREDLKV